MIELSVFKIMLLKKYYQDYIHVVDMDSLKTSNKYLYKMYQVLSKYHHHTQEDISLNNFEIFFSTENKERSNEEDYREIFRNIRELSFDEALVQTLLKQLHERSFATKLAITAIEVSEGKREFRELIELSSKAPDGYSSSGVEEQSPFVNSSLKEIANEIKQNPGLRWGIGSLNRSIGSLRKGDFGFLFARPEVGKTTFLASQASNFALQTDGYILHFNNEEDWRRIQLRYYQAVLGLTNKELLSKLDVYEKKYMELTGDRIKIIDNPSISKIYVEKIVDKYKPSCIIFDSIDKLRGFDQDRDDLVYKQIYGWARELAKSYAPVIGVCHASASGEGKRYLEMDDVAYAKTAKQSEADWILGIGKSHGDIGNYVRHFHICKNKLLGDEDTDPQLRHAKIDVIIKPEVATYCDFGE